MSEKDPRRRYTANLQGEVDSASLYRTLSQTGKNAELAQVYARLGAVEEAHAEFWKRKIGAIGQRVPSLRPSSIFFIFTPLKGPRRPKEGSGWGIDLVHIAGQ